MKYMKNKYGDENGNVVSFWSTDDNVLCKDGKTLRENLDGVNSQFKDIAKQTITTEERTKLNSLKNYDDSEIKNKLNEKANKNQIFTMANMGQDIKESMTNGSVAVVGNNMILKNNIVPNQINYDKTDFIECGKNLLNLNNITSNCYIDNQGRLIENTHYVTTDYILFKKGEKLSLSRKSTNGVHLRDIRTACFYDSDYAPITDIFYDNLKNVVESINCTNENVFCVRVSFLSGYADNNTMLYKGEEVNYIEEFYYNIDELIPNNKMVQKIDETIENIDISTLLKDNKVIGNENIKPYSLKSNVVDFINLKGNLLVMDECLEDYYIGDNGVYHNTTTYVTTDFIKISKGQFITLSRNSKGSIGTRPIRTACFYDANFNLIEFYDNPNNVCESIKCDKDNTHYIKLSFNKGFFDSKINSLTYGNQIPSKIKENKIELKNSNVLEGKHIVGFGDSIVYGAGNNGYGIADIIAENNNMTYENKAVGGATILKRTDNNIPKQIEEYVGTPDYIVLDGYINDCTFTDVLTVLGDISPYYGATFDDSTIIGQFETMLRDLLTKFHTAKIVYVCVHHMASRDDAKVKVVHEKIISACKKWSIPVVDLYEEGQLNTTITVHKEKYTDNQDSTHPNRLGYDLFYIPKIETKLKTL